MDGMQSRIARARYRHDNANICVNRPDPLIICPPSSLRHFNASRQGSSKLTPIPCKPLGSSLVYRQSCEQE
jgi:hypothetical protein